MIITIKHNNMRYHTFNAIIFMIMSSLACLGQSSSGNSIVTKTNIKEIQDFISDDGNITTFMIDFYSFEFTGQVVKKYLNSQCNESRKLAIVLCSSSDRQKDIKVVNKRILSSLKKAKIPIENASNIVFLYLEGKYNFGEIEKDLGLQINQQTVPFTIFKQYNEELIYAFGTAELDKKLEVICVK